MQFENTQVFNFEGAFRGMRNPLESWDKSDSFFGIINYEYPQDAREEVVEAWIVKEIEQKHIEVDPFSEEWEELWYKHHDWLCGNECLIYDHDLEVVATLGPNDLGLAQKLILAGTEHAKFLRQIFVSVDITAPLYWWKEFDTYKIGTTANSTSTMHKLTSKPITVDCFELDNDNLLIYTYYADVVNDQNELIKTLGCEWNTKDEWEFVIEECEKLRQRYIETKDLRYWRALIQVLPNSWLQTRTITMSYANLRNIYFQRRSHKLIEWLKFCNWITTLPYGLELITLEDKNEIN